MIKECQKEYIKVFDDIAFQNPLTIIMKEGNFNNHFINLAESYYSIPTDDLKDLRETFLPGYYVMWGTLIITLILTTLGLFV